jgi:hypothetical protein
MFYDKVLSTYSSWEDVDPDVTGYPNNFQKVYKAREEVEQAYSELLAEQHGYDVAPNIAVHGTPKIIGDGAPKITGSRLHHHWPLDLNQVFVVTLTMCDHL